MTYDYEVEVTRAGSEEVLATAIFTSEDDMRGYAEAMRAGGFKTRSYDLKSRKGREPINA
jgi:hypothetical protein